MQITTATRTVEIYANTEAGITYRNVKDGKATGPVRSANRATAKAGSVGREILDAIDAIVSEEEEAERAATPAEIVAPVTETVEVEVAAQVTTEIVTGDRITTKATIWEAGRTGRVTQVPAGATWVGVTWDTDTAGSRRPSYGFAYLSQITKV